MDTVVKTQTSTVLSGSDMLIEALRRENVDYLFGYPGGAVIPIYDSLYHAKDIQHILCRHEQATIHAADGYARVSGKIGVALVTSGPGATNAVTGIANAYMDSVPMVIITGQVSQKMIGRDSFQEVNIYGMTQDITKHNYLVLDVRELPRILKEAFHIAQTGRPGPVLIDIPKNVMIAKAEFNYDEPLMLRGYRPCPAIPPKLIERTIECIEQAKNPVLLVGGGVISSGASVELSELAERAQIPVVSTLMGIGAYPSRSSLHLGMLGMHGTFAANKAVHHADLLICLGVRFSDRATGQIKAFSPQSFKIHVDIDAAEINKNVSIDLPVTGDLMDFLSQINQALRPGIMKDWVEEVSTWSKRVPRFEEKDSKSTLNPQHVIQLLDELTQGDAVIVTDVGQHQIWTAHHYAFSHPRSFITSAGLGTMGFGLPAAVGTAFAAPERQVICVSGDGSFQMNSQEIMTAVEYQLPVKVAILNNGYLGMVRQWQELFYQRRYSSVKISSPDFISLARAYGAAGLRANTDEEARKIIAEALATPGPVIMEFNVKEEENVYPMVPPGASNHELIFPE